MNFDRAGENGSLVIPLCHWDDLSCCDAQQPCHAKVWYWSA